MINVLNQNTSVCTYPVLTDWKPFKRTDIQRSIFVLDANLIELVVCIVRHRVPVAVVNDGIVLANGAADVRFWDVRLTWQWT